MGWFLLSLVRQAARGKRTAAACKGRRDQHRVEYTYPRARTILLLTLVSLPASLCVARVLVSASGANSLLSAAAARSRVAFRLAAAIAASVPFCIVLACP